MCVYLYVCIDCMSKVDFNFNGKASHAYNCMQLVTYSYCSILIRTRARTRKRPTKHQKSILSQGVSLIFVNNNPCKYELNGTMCSGNKIFSQ